jgi:hypothetical protein
MNEILDLVSRLALKEIPITLLLILIIGTGKWWWDNGGEEIARRTLKRPGLGGIWLGWVLLFILLIAIGLLTDSAISWWYMTSSIVGALVCVLFLKWIVISVATEELPHVEVREKTREDGTMQGAEQTPVTEAPLKEKTVGDSTDDENNGGDQSYLPDSHEISWLLIVIVAVILFGSISISMLIGRLFSWLWHSRKVRYFLAKSPLIRVHFN